MELAHDPDRRALNHDRRCAPVLEVRCRRGRGADLAPPQRFDEALHGALRVEDVDPRAGRVPGARRAEPRQHDADARVLPRQGAGPAALEHAPDLEEPHVRRLAANVGPERLQKAEEQGRAHHGPVRRQRVLEPDDTRIVR